MGAADRTTFWWGRGGRPADCRGSARDEGGRTLSFARIPGLVTVSSSGRRVTRGGNGGDEGASKGGHGTFCENANGGGQTGDGATPLGERGRPPSFPFSSSFYLLSFSLSPPRNHLLGGGELSLFPLQCKHSACRKRAWPASKGVIDRQRSILRAPRTSDRGGLHQTNEDALG